MFDVTDPDQGKHTMTGRNVKSEGIDVKKRCCRAMMGSFERLCERRCRRFGSGYDRGGGRFEG